ncbi:MAG: copper homeostasis protein CutC [Bacteroidales bacterium]|nr:copper homeostasis protein CutC [Bacteroidales bacterium]MDD4385208.1 copper homeostasis protein CutC [Bacteroidales bacterium]MDY0198212.1 copper homeostasis protein CutC [Tenuifilaceae bacterium]
MAKRKLEICCFTAESALRAAQAGAHRIELCDNIAEGGTTPSHATIDWVVKQLQIPVNVIVRPRGGDFLYSDMEYHLIKEDIAHIKRLGANGIVIGFLTPTGEINVQKTAEIIKLAAPMEVTFHRAFDMCNNPFEALEQLKELGVTRILTSGGYANAKKGAHVIAQLVQKANDEIIIMPGSGINHRNLGDLIVSTMANEYHSSAKIFIDGGMQFKNNNVSMSGNDAPDEFRHISVDSSQIKKMLSILNEHN